MVRSIRPRSGGALRPGGARRVTSPGSGNSLRDNAGSVRITVEVEPPVGPDHHLEARMGGQGVGFISGERLSLTNVDCGEHELRTHIVDANGTSLQQSKAIRFTRAMGEKRGRLWSVGCSGTRTLTTRWCKNRCLTQFNLTAMIPAVVAENGVAGGVC